MSGAKACAFEYAEHEAASRAGRAICNAFAQSIGAECRARNMRMNVQRREYTGAVNPRSLHTSVKAL